MRIEIESSSVTDPTNQVTELSKKMDPVAWHTVETRGSPAVVKSLLEAAKTVDKIGMIKAAREILGLGLKETKDLIESVLPWRGDGQ